MAIVHGVAGEWARVKGSVIGLWPLFASIFAAGFAVAFLLVSVLTGVFLLVLALGFGGWSLVRGLRHVERFFKGARGEERVAGILKELPDTYQVFNDFVADGSHIEHVVVGPAGVFAVETKYWKGNVTIEDGHILLDGQLPDRSPLTQACKEAQQVKGVLTRAGWTGAVTPVLAFASDTFRQHIAEIHGAVVLNSCELQKSFSTERVVIPPMELERLVALMESLS